MAGRIFGSPGKIGNSASPTIAGFQVQTSIYGLPIPIVYGQARVAGNLIQKYPATVTPQVAQGSRSKLAPKVDQNVSGYLYQAPIVLALSEGPIAGIGKVWRDKDAAVPWSVYAAAGWSLFLGTLTQAAWAYLTSNHPGDAFPYQLTAYVAHPSLELPNDVLSNYTWEVQGLFQFGSGIVDANPKDIVTDILTNSNHGCSFPAAQLDALTAYSQYCIAAGLFLSPVLNAQGPLTDQLAALFQATNSGPVWSDGRLKVIPYADQAITGNSVTYTPNVTPIYDLSDDDFIAPEGTDPVDMTRKDAADCYNQVLVQFNDRALEYNPNIQEAKDQGTVDLFGLRPMPTVQFDAVKDLATARYIAQLILQRELNVRNAYQFTLSMRYSLLEPMDLVTLTDVGLGLNKTTVRITTIEESDTGDLVFTAEEFPAGVASASRYGAPGATGTIPANNIAPGPTSAEAIFEGPGALLQSAIEIWIAASGGPNWGGCDVYLSTDNVTYNKAGSITKKGNFGVLTSALPAGPAVPALDTTHTLAVDLSSSGGSLVAGSPSDLEAIITLCLVENEFLAYEGASLTSANHYSLTTLARGIFGLPIPSSHAIGAPFVRCDGSLLKVPFPQGFDGEVVFFKFPAFNVFGLALEDLAAVSPVAHTIGVNLFTSGSLSAPPRPSIKMSTQTSFVVNVSFDAQVDYGQSPVSWRYRVVGDPTRLEIWSTPVVGGLPAIVGFFRPSVKQATIELEVTQLDTQVDTAVFNIQGQLTSVIDGTAGSGTEGSTRGGVGGVPVGGSRIHAVDQYDATGGTILIDRTLGRSFAAGPTGIAATTIEDGGNKGHTGFSNTTGALVSTAVDSRSSLLNTHFRASVDDTSLIVDGTGSPLSGGKRGFSTIDSSNRVKRGNGFDDGDFGARATNSTGLALHASVIDSRSSLLNSHFRISVDSADSVVDGTGSPLSGGRRGQVGLNSSSLLITGVHASATGVDGYGNIESRRGASRQGGHAMGYAGETHVRSGSGGVPTPGGQIFSEGVYLSDGSAPVYDPVLGRLTSNMNGPTGVGMGTVETGGVRGNGGFVNSTGGLVSTAQDSRSSLLNTHFRYSVDLSDGIVDGTGSPIGGGKRGFSTIDSSNRVKRGNGFDDGNFGATATDAAGFSLHSSVGDSRSSLLNTHFRYSVDSSDGIVDGTGSPISGGKRGFSTIDSNNRLINIVRQAMLATGGPTSFQNTSSPLSSSGGTITIASHSVFFGGTLTVVFNSGTVVVGGSGLWYVYADDPTYAGGAVTYIATGAKADLSKSDGRYYVGQITTTTGGPGTGAQGGAGGVRPV